MPAFGKIHRTRRPASRGWALVGTGGAALVLPLIVPAAAGAAAVAGAPEAVVRAVASPSATGSAAAPAKTPAAATYTVVHGDSLSLIAQKKGIQGGWKSLYQANKSTVGDNPSVILPGLELTLHRISEKAVQSVTFAPAAATGAAASRAVTAVLPTLVPAVVEAAPAAAVGYADNLDGWIREALDIMAQRGIPGSYDAIHRNVMRESSGNPQAINLWDSNAAAGIPSKGLLQVIEPTFRAYHVPGTALDLFDPVANITAACNYAAARYGSIDNVNGAY
ncbi:MULTISPECIES: LysM peptidoglycan-binding domain-containing protein [unclassified Streptomyces]|uniref:LysM peptidoglycan-binding domain-containing protein n=1 Tax=unclassified Streptomyces TaxID=2593676 RepID=UPI0016604E81|nr:MULTISPECIES: LysM peptidoglycan-binding domain-containing protein [unclassified Streptomyces]MBD0708297.1 peptidoglycan-binding protein [Streptomyces sp. CBMA291]MBD0712653.1 peptidoglycan-binding protein [Streptomyces sp. CBMA370]